MSKRKERITPFTKQCFVTLGVSLNMAAAGLVMGFTTGLLQQLRAPDSSIPVDDSSGSWIAALPGLTLVAGNFIAPSIIARYGRKSANLISIIPLIIGFIQGLCMGMATSLGSALIGEYSSPNNRGAFLMTISASIAISVLAVHTMGSYLSWKITALICGIIALVDLVIVFLSPESPSWLAEQGRYEECRKIYRWLRGNNEEEELKRMIEASIIIKEAQADINVPKSIVKKLKLNLVYFSTTVQKKEFIKPIIIMIHIYTIAQWSGVNLMVPYAIDLFHKVVGRDVNIPLNIIALDSHRIIANILAVYIIKKMKRRTMLLATTTLNIFALITTAGYTYAKENHVLPFDSPIIGTLLIHIMMFAIATGTLPLCFIIAGEIFPLEFRSLAGGISVLFYSTHLFVSVKTIPNFLATLGIHGTYLLYSIILAYCLIVSAYFLPETKDRTLQDIEDEFRGRKLTIEELKSVQSLTSWKNLNHDRRCSTPVVV
ncbi:hypothetical protein K1T71_013400 [Dendrolimus kikuchii]|uniref:Uncharacterized protein n=1 Tax=Dendrolimus kikuchii TaxID=765133 RepID=A0ACC1CI89_9NEOP|nr:hypothetical protein K1T71_013400 [Dendrolimus kikuchii]